VRRRRRGGPSATAPEETKPTREEREWKREREERKDR